MNHRLVDRVGGLVGEDTRRKTRNQFLHLELTAQFHHIHVHNDVVIVELHLVIHVVEQTTDLGSQMDHICWLVLLKHGTSGRTIPIHEPRIQRLQEIAILGAQEYPVFILLLAVSLCSFQSKLDSVSHQSSSTSNKNSFLHL